MGQLYVNKGQLATFGLVVTRSGVVVDLTSVSLTFEARKDSPTGTLVLSKSIGSGIIITDAPNGKATLSILPADTATLALDQPFMYYQLILDAGLGPEDIEDGTLLISDDTTPNLYVTVEDVRALGVTATQASDALVLETIKTWQQFIERVCRQWFYPLELELNVDGTDSDAIHFGVPAIAITELRLNGSDTALDPKLYRVYNNLSTLSDRHNPRVKLVDTFDGHRDIFTAPLKDGKLQFRFGRKNQYIKGVFGYVESDGSTPLLIRRALTLLVVEKLTKPIFIDPANPPPLPPPLMSGVVLEEWTDGHKIKYAQSGGELRPRAPGLAGITDNPEVLGILKLYRAPIGVATPNNPSVR